MNSKEIRFSSCLVAFLASAFQAFGMYNVHAISGITEGGVLGAILLIRFWTGISPAVSSLILNCGCYLLGMYTFGKSFLLYSFSAAAGYSFCYRICEMFHPIYPTISTMPLLASILGSIFVGFGSGLTVRIGGATSGDDAFAMSISRISGIKIQWIYLVSDLSVLLLSLTYIPLSRICYSLLTVVLSGQIIGILQKNPKSK